VRDANPRPLYRSRLRWPIELCDRTSAASVEGYRCLSASRRQEAGRRSMSEAIAGVVVVVVVVAAVVTLSE
jgi:hypothetical protein